MPDRLPCHDGHLEEAAYHESGHAVIGLLHGFEIEGLSIAPTEDYVGSCDWGHKRFRNGMWQCSAQEEKDIGAGFVLASMAGFAAERASAFGWSGAVFDPPPEESDAKLVRQFATVVDGDDVAGVISRAWSIVGDLIQEPNVAGALDTLAAHLLTNRTVDGSAAARVVRACLKSTTVGSLFDRRRRLRVVVGPSPR